MIILLINRVRWQQWIAERRMHISKTDEAQESLLEYMSDITDSISKAVEHSDQTEI